MSPKDALAPIVELYGGEYKDTAPDLLPPEISAQFRGATRLIVEQFPHFEPAETGRVDCVLVNSSAMNPRVHSLEGGARLIVFPVGVLIRIYWIAHAVFEYWGEGLNVTIAGSPLDDLPPEWYEIAGPLKPLFVDYAQESDFWTDMNALAPLVVRKPDFEHDARSIARLAAQFLVWHELGHIQLGHFTLRKNPLLPDWRDWMGVDDHDFQAGLEAQADRFASSALIHTLLGEIEYRRGGRPEIERAFGLCTAGLMLMLGAFWPAKKFVAGYKGLGNQHPLVRREMIADAIAAALADDAAKTELFRQIDLKIWEQVVWASNRLAMYAHERYKTSGTVTVMPLLSSLSYGTGFAFPFIEAHRVRAAYLLSAADGILKTHTDFRSRAPQGKDPDAFLASLAEVFKQHDLQVQDQVRKLKPTP